MPVFLYIVKWVPTASSSMVDIGLVRSTTSSRFTDVRRGLGGGPPCRLLSEASRRRLSSGIEYRNSRSPNLTVDPEKRRGV